MMGLDLGGAMESLRKFQDEMLPLLERIADGVDRLVELEEKKGEF